MSSEVKANKLSPATGVTTTLGDASDVFQLPASAEIDIASGATLDVNGTLDVTGATVTGLNTGLSEIDYWGLTANLTVNTAAVLVSANLARRTTNAFSHKGTGMSVSSGIWTFPSTGWYQCTGQYYYLLAATGGTYIGGTIETTNDNGTGWDSGVSQYNSNPSSGYNTGVTIMMYFKVSNTSNDKIRFRGNSSINSTLIGSAGGTVTQSLFTKLSGL